MSSPLAGRKIVANVAGAFLDFIAEASEESMLKRRRRIFREMPLKTVQRWLLGTAYAFHPKRIADLPPLVWYAVADLIRGGTSVPSATTLRDRPDGFAGVCRAISPAGIMAAGREGFYPWCHVGPLKWWSPRERMVLSFEDHHIAKRFRPILRKTPWRVTFDTAFDDVVKACAAPRTNRAHALTWITPQIMRLYAQLHDQGHAHSVEVWDEQGQLIGGVYGLAIGKVFVTESLFFRESNASKIALHVLNHHLAKWGFIVNDNKAWSGIMEQMGYRLIPRADYNRIVAEHARNDLLKGKWKIEDSPAAIAG